MQHRNVGLFGFALLAAAMLHTAAVSAQTSHVHVHSQEHAPARHEHGGGEPAARDERFPEPSAEELAAAFPDLGDRDIRRTLHDDPFVSFVLFDRVEVQDADGGDVLAWDAKAWAGRDLDKLWIRTEGERRSGATEHSDLELLYGRAFSPWWDWVAGVRHDFAPGRSQTWAAFGIQGLAPYRFEVEATGYVGEGGRTAARLEVEYDLLMTNRLVLQPLLGLEWHGRDDPPRGVGSGLGTVEAGLRLRYEIRREVAPYVGLVRLRKVGGTADFARAAGHAARETRAVAGIRVWF